MRKTLLASILILCAAPAMAQSANERARREADSYLLPCSSTDKDEFALCKAESEKFRGDYLKAKAGDYTSQSNVSFVLARGETGAGARIAKPNPLQACAWVLAMFAGGSPDIDLSDRSMITTRCGRLDEGAQAMARQRAAAILTEIKTAPTRPPPPPRERPLKAPLDGTAYRLGEGP